MPEDRPSFSDHAASILAAEHWSLLSDRFSSWNESFSRMSLFLNTLSASVLALALVANANGFGRSFTSFAAVLFPIVLFLEMTTYLRLVRINVRDVYLMAAMNRIRRGYLDMAPELAPYFTASADDDSVGVWRSYLFGMPPPRQNWMSLLLMTPTVLATINGIVAAAAAGFIAERLEMTVVGIVSVSSVVALAVWSALFRFQVRAFSRLLPSPRFPAESSSGSSAGSSA